MLNKYFMLLTFTDCIIMLLVFLYLYSQFKTRFLGLWSIGGVLLFVKTVFDFIIITEMTTFAELPTIALLADHLLFMLAGLCLFTGACLFMKMKIPRWWGYSFIVCIIWSSIGTVYQSLYAYFVLPPVTYLGMSLIWAGMMLARNKEVRSLGNHLTGMVLVIWGFHFPVYPYLLSLPAIIPLVFYLAAGLSTLAVVGVILMYFQQARNELSKREKRFRLLAENAQDIVYHVSVKPKIRFEYLNTAVENVTGYPTAEYYRNPELFLRIIHPEDINLAEVIEKPEKWFLSAKIMRVVRPDNSMIWLEQRNVPIYDATGQIAAFVGIARDITETKRVEKELEYLSYHDAMTGLGNRLNFERQLSILNEESQSSVGIIVCDIDGLKLINDTLGHKMGDSVIRETGRVIKTHFRENDIMSRIGGDEFAIIQKNVCKKDLEGTCLRLRELLLDHNQKNPGLPLGLSIGYAFSNKKDFATHELFQKADQEMYKDKLKQGNMAQLKILNVFIEAIADREQMRESISEGMQELAICTAQKIGFNRQEIKRLKQLTTYHNIGMLAISPKLLYKKGPLTREEILELQNHCEIGARLAKSTRELEQIADLILKHHEWWNGGGYPLGIKGEQIPAECRILTIIDAYDAMQKNTPYRAAYDEGCAIAELKKGSATQFDPQILEIFINILAQREQKTS